MKLSGLLLILVCAVSCAEEKVTTPEKKRLESVTWDLQTHKLVWVVESGKPGPERETSVCREEPVRDIPRRRRHGIS